MSGMKTDESGMWVFKSSEKVKEEVRMLYKIPISRVVVLQVIFIRNYYTFGKAIVAFQRTHDTLSMKVRKSTR